MDQPAQTDKGVATIETGSSDSAKLEFEGIPSKVFTLYDNSHAKSAIAKNVSNFYLFMLIFFLFLNYLREVWNLFDDN